LTAGVTLLDIAIAIATIAIIVRGQCIICGEARGRAFLAERLDLLGQVFRARETVEQRTLTPSILGRIQVHKS
jgi:hypothetical protein